MADLIKLETMYEKEIRLYQDHKRKAEELKRLVDEEKAQQVMKSVKHLNLSPEDFKKLQRVLSDEGTVMKLIGNGGNGIGHGTGEKI